MHNNPNKKLERELTLSNIETEMPYEEINLKIPLETNLNIPHLNQETMETTTVFQSQQRVNKFREGRAFSFEPMAKRNNSFNFPPVRGTRSNNDRSYLKSNEKVNLPHLISTIPRKNRFQSKFEVGSLSI